MTFLWVVNLFNGTGLGAAYRTTEYARLIVLALAVLILMEKIRKEHGCYVQKRYFYELLALVLVFVTVSFGKGYRWMGLDYLWIFLIVFILSCAKPSRSVLRFVGLIYGSLGLMILLIYGYTDILSGWNPNSIAMIGLFSYLVFMIPYYGARDFRSFLTLAMAGTVYAFLIIPTESRSCIATILMALLFSFRILSMESLLRSPAGVLAALLVPLGITGFSAILSGSGVVESLNQWSLTELGKPVFNGRDVTWLEGFRQLKENLLLGSGYISAGLWHNSAMACLTAYGIVGYYLWIRLFHMIIEDAEPHTADVCVMGSMSAFMIIYWQQSVELGIFAPNPNVLPYAILGILLGRINRIKN